MKDLNAFDIKEATNYLWFSESMGIELNNEKSQKDIKI